ncbi:MAG: glycosyltransferase [Anaerostipes hadrus]
MEPLISVIIPVYNVEKYLNKCITSVVEQTYKNLEIIIVDDGSTDQSPEICDEWKKRDSRIQVVHSSNGGAGKARNTALDIATGDYVTFVDSDDYIAPQMYQVLLEQFYDGIGIVECNYSMVYDDSEEFKEKRKIYKIHTYSAVEAMHENINDHIFRQLIWNKMYRKDVIKGIYFPTGKKIDDEFWTYQAIGNASKLIYMDQKLYAYRQQEQSVMHLLDAKKRLEALKAKEERHIYICEFMPQLKTESLNNLWFTCIYQGQRVLKDKNKENLKSVYPQIKRFIKKYPQTNLKDITDKKQKIWIIFAKISFCGTCKIRNLLKIGL